MDIWPPSSRSRDRVPTYCLKMQFIFLLLIAHLVHGDIIVFTNNGPIKGKSLPEKNLEAFFGIPFAEPPIGSLRFAKPVPKSSWTETYNADKLPVACIQGVFEDFPDASDFKAKMSEDCLYLNLWVPVGGQNPKTIMVYIHGGAYMFGSSNMKEHDGSSLAQHGDVIFASMNYRLGTLGFFLGFTEEAAGNMAMYDQLMAMQWIKDNAKHFGGDPENIVLIGESAGAFSVSLHTVSPLSRNLFRRAIVQSGSSFHPMLSDDNRILSLGSQAVANLLGCAEDNKDLKENPQKVVDCMRNLPAETFSEKDLILFNSFGMLIPRVGDDFLPLNPIDSLLKCNSKNSELLIGVTRDEGSLLISGFRSQIFGELGEKVNISSFDESLSKEILLSLMNISYDGNIVQSYLDRVKYESRYSYLNAMSDVFGDYLITCSTVYEADYKSMSRNPVFFYVFDYRPVSSPLPEWMGVAHATDLIYVLGNPQYGELTDYEKVLSKDIMDMWIAFAKTGNPNLPGRLTWPRYSSHDPKHLVIGQRDRVGFRPDNYRCEEWRNYFRAMRRRHCSKC